MAGVALAAGGGRSRRGWAIAVLAVVAAIGLGSAGGVEGYYASRVNIGVIGTGYGQFDYQPCVPGQNNWMTTGIWVYNGGDSRVTVRWRVYIDGKPYTEGLMSEPAWINGSVASIYIDRECLHHTANAGIVWVMPGSWY